jgi:hypothetical protein
MIHIPFLQKPFLCLLFFSAFMFCHHSSAAKEIGELLEQHLTDDITVDLRNPLYSEGVLSTDQGGVITTSQIRIQALHLRYTRQSTQEEVRWTLEAEGELMVDFGEYVFVGDKLFYDFQKKEGVIYNGRTIVEPWHFGGERLELRSDGSYLIYNGYVTTSENAQPDWGLYSSAIEIKPDNNLQAQHVHVKLFNYELLCIPSLRANLNSIFDNPISYRFRWSGKQGPRFGFTYEIFSWRNWKTFIRFDYRLTRGPGGGIETRYRSMDHRTEFRSINYLAKDSSILHPHEKARYRFEGIFKKRMHDDKTEILFSYDRISDRNMPSTYYDREFDFDTAEKTQFLIRRREERWITQFYTRVRVNSFQTVKQELPTLDINFKPYAFPRVGLIAEQWASASYLNFKYSNYLPCVKDYSSTRLEYRPTLYRPFRFGRFFTATPTMGAVTILYGDSPQRDAQWVALGTGGLDIQTQLYRQYRSFKHLIEPYAGYHYYSSPTSSSHRHYIFDIEDGWNRLNTLSFGVRNIFFVKDALLDTTRLFTFDLYTYAFFHTDKINQTIPKIYGRFTLPVTPTVKQSLETVWNLEHQELDQFNWRTEWTLSADFALAVEYRHRGPYYWRKVDQENFFLDVFRCERQLRHSPLSDRRDTLLIHFFYRFHPNWACEFTSRQGWNRLREPSYFEYEIDLLTTIQTAWHLRFSFQHQENVNRFAIYLNVGLKRPDLSECTK